MTINLTHARAIRVAAATLVAACGDQSRGPASYELRDSAGIQIHEYGQSALEDAPRWILSATPVLDIGSGLEDDPRYEFFRIESVDRLNNGSFVVLIPERARSGSMIRPITTFGTLAGWARVRASLLRRSGSM